MSCFVLVHGSFQGGWIWQPTARLLAAAGHAVYTPTLEGCAERRHALRPGISVSSAAGELADLLFFEDLQEVVLAGTSSGGMVVQKLASLAPERIAKLVFIDALVPMPGESVTDIVQRQPGAAPYARTELARGPSREQLASGLFADLQGEQLEWALDRATMHPIGLSDHAPGELDAFWAASWSVTVARCTRSPNPPESHQRRTAEHFAGRYVEIDAGHYPMLSHPRETVQALTG
ncbi:MAG: alpha/beta fold hydrolase [Gammaproteobacteria bacterium]|nr:alpha/beta fold hydrolase [Gammaproteobacteria bacterium]